MCKRKRRYTSRIYVYIKVNSQIEKMWRAHTHNTTAAKKKFKRNGITILQFKSKPLNGAACIMCVCNATSYFLADEEVQNEE